MKNNEVDTENIHRVLKGDTAAFRFLVERYQNMVFTIAFRIVGNREEAEDISQEAFTKCYRSLNRYNYQSQFSTWLYRITYNHSIDCLKKRKSRLVETELKDSIYDSEPVHSTFEGDIDNKVLQEVLKVAIERLPAEDRIIVILYYYDDLPLREIADVVGIKENHVKIKLHRIRSKLLLYLQNKQELINTIISKN